jgi:hypothetical protein
MDRDILNDELRQRFENGQALFQPVSQLVIPYIAGGDPIGPSSSGGKLTQNKQMNLTSTSCRCRSRSRYRGPQAGRADFTLLQRLR